MRQLIAALLLWTATATAQCAIPWNLTINSTDQCAALKRIEWGWAEAQKRAWWPVYAQEPFGWANWKPYRHIPLEAAGLLTVTEHPGSYFPNPYGQGNLGGLYVNWFGLAMVDYSVDWPLSIYHELAHHLFWLLRPEYGETAWTVVGHGTTGDPYYKFLSETRGVLYDGLPANHSYMPVLGPSSVEPKAVTPASSNSDGVICTFRGP